MNKKFQKIVQIIILVILALAVAMSLLVPITAAFSAPAPDASTTTITGLNSAGSVIDGQEVVFTGEAVGDIIVADANKSWVTLYDQDQTISAYLAADHVSLISFLGRYDARGTTLKVKGVYRLACAEHDGLSDVHVTQASVVDVGERAQHKLDWQFAAIGAALVVFGAILLLIQRKLRNKAR